MVFKDISYLELWRPFCSGEQNHLCNFGRSHHKEQFCEIISYLELWPPFCSAEPIYLCNFDRGYSEVQFCEIILNLDEWFRRCHLKDYLSGALVAIVFSGAEPYVQFCRGHYGEHTCEVILNLDQWFKRRCRLKKKVSHDAHRTTHSA